jgi:hypothetical protein
MGFTELYISLQLSYQKLALANGFPAHLMHGSVYKLRGRIENASMFPLSALSSAGYNPAA